jgi:hypothetical protein
LAALLRAAAHEALWRRRRARTWRGSCRPGFAVPVPKETLSATRIGIPPRVRTHEGESMWRRAQGQMNKASRYPAHSPAQHTSAKPSGEVVLGHLLVGVLDELHDLADLRSEPTRWAGEGSDEDSGSFARLREQRKISRRPAVAPGCRGPVARVRAWYRGSRRSKGLTCCQPTRSPQ